jgi:hypothetical protein
MAETAILDLHKLLPVSVFLSEGYSCLYPVEIWSNPMKTDRVIKLLIFSRGPPPSWISEKLNADFIPVFYIISSTGLSNVLFRIAKFSLIFFV